MASELLSVSPEELRIRWALADTREAVAEMLEMSYARLSFYVHRLDEEDRYRAVRIRKRRDGYRTLFVPARTLKIAQKRLNQVLQAVYVPKPPVHGFTTDRSIATNALVHARRRYVLNVDLRDFFPSINFGRVRGLFRRFPYLRNDDVATFLAQLCCFKNELPQGSPSSPVISNMICARMDGELMRLARTHRASYTRYGDDITFSTSLLKFPPALAFLDAELTPPVIRVGTQLEQIVTDNGFEINESKVRLRPASRRQEVTGVIVNRSPNVSRAYVRQVRAMLHAWERYGLQQATHEFANRYDRKDRGGFTRELNFARVVKGKIDYMAMIRGKQDGLVRRYLEWYAQLQPGYKLPPAAASEANYLVQVRDSLWVLECEESQTQGSAFMLEGYGLVTCAHVIGPATRAFKPEAPTVQYPVGALAVSTALDVAILEIDVEKPYALKKSSANNMTVGAKVTVAGFPNYRLGDSGWVSSGSLAGFRTVATVRRLLVDTPIVAGCSGGPVLDSRNKVIGIAVTGADRMENAGDTENHGVIPIDVIDIVVREAELSAPPEPPESE